MKVSGYDKMSVYFDPEYSEVFDVEGNPLNLVAMDANNPTYKISVINCDLIKSQIINFTIPDKRYIPNLLGPSYARIRTLSLESELTDLPPGHTLDKDDIVPDGPEEEPPVENQPGMPGSENTNQPSGGDEF